MTSQLPILTLMGPTASGKTSLALELAQNFPIEIISVDSALVYEEMNVGTAKPSKQEQAQVPHHLMDICKPNGNFSAGAFVREANKSITDILSRKKIPLLVGGTMLYFKALFEGLAQIPHAPPEIRTSLKQGLEKQGLAKLYETLKEVDPHSATKIHANDAQRILRALEVFQASGKPLSFWQMQNQNSISFENPTLQIALMPEDRARLHESIAQRFEQMLQQGFVDEVIQLKEKYLLTLDSPSMRCVGYRQVMEYLNGQTTFDEMKLKGIYATRQLAKRQMTWLRTWPQAEFVFSHRLDTFADVKKLIDDIM